MFSRLSRHTVQCDQPHERLQFCPASCVRAERRQLETFPLETSPADSLRGPTHSVLLPTSMITMTLVMQVIMCLAAGLYFITPRLALSGFCFDSEKKIS
jgi:hypothetical protein